MPRALPAGQDSPVQPLSEIGQTDRRMTILVVRLGPHHTREFQLWGAAHGWIRGVIPGAAPLANTIVSHTGGVPMGAILSRKMVSTDASLTDWGVSTEAGAICRSVQCACTWTGLSPSGEAISSLSPEPVPTRVPCHKVTPRPLGCGSNCFGSF